MLRLSEGVRLRETLSALQPLHRYHYRCYRFFFCLFDFTLEFYVVFVSSAFEV